MSRAAARALAAVIAAVAVLLPAQPALAHAALLESTPPDGVLLQTAPAEVVLRFSERVGTSLGAVRVVAPDGNRADTGRVSTRASGKQVVAPLREDLPPGTYLLLWRVVSEDSHPVSGVSTFSFGRESPVATADVGEAGGGAAGGLLTASRGVLYAGLVVLVGGLLFVLVVWPSGRNVPIVRRAVSIGWVRLRWQRAPLACCCKARTRPACRCETRSTPRCSLTCWGRGTARRPLCGSGCWPSWPRG
jgi:copper transport protein